MSQLVNGKIPAYTECPFAETCIAKKDGVCWHKGIKHTVEFSCGTARAMELINGKQN